MPVVTPCSRPGCTTLTLGEFCLAHAQAPSREFPRGRPASFGTVGAAAARPLLDGWPARPGTHVLRAAGAASATAP